MAVRDIYRVCLRAIQEGSCSLRNCATGSVVGAVTMYVGVRCTMVTWLAMSYIDGLEFKIVSSEHICTLIPGKMVIAVAPDPISATLLPFKIWSCSEVQFWGCTIVPKKFSCPEMRLVTCLCHSMQVNS